MGLGLELTSAIRFKNEGKTRKLLERIDAVATNEVDFYGYGFTPLHAAALKNNAEAVAKLLSIHGINVNARSNCGWTPIMYAARTCSVEALRALLDHPTVDLDNEGMELEDLVGDGYANVHEVDLTKKSKCLEMIQEARRNREIVRLEKDITTHTNGFSESSLEEMKTKVRKVYIDKIDKVNQQVQQNEKKMKYNVELRMIKIKNIEEKQNLKSNQEKIKLEQKKSKLEQELVKIQEEIKKHDEEMKKNLEHEKAILEDTFEKGDKEIRQQQSRLKEISNQLTKELRKQDMDPDDDASANLEAARDTLECPVCMEIMKPPTKIFMCPSSHLVCETCKSQLEGRLCPTCRTEGVTWRAIMAEKFARTLFNN